MTGSFIRRSLAICAVALGLAILAAPAYAQSGQVRGKVVDAQGAPVDGAKVVIQNTETSGRSLETKTNKKGEYIQIGLSPGKYKITVSKGDLTVTKEVQIHLDMAQLDFQLVPGQGGAPMSKEEAAKQQAKVKAVQQAFTDAVALSNDNKNEEAIAKFQEVLTTIPNCAECYANIGTIQGRMKNYEASEASYKKAIELKPDFGEAYTGLATVYNAEKKFDLAAEASKKATELSGGAAGAAGGGGNAAAIFNQGVILWNAGKIPEAQAQFEQAVKLDPTMAEAHYWLGMSFLNAGKTADAKPHFEEYLKLAPTGQYAETAKSIIASIK